MSGSRFGAGLLVGLLAGGAAGAGGMWVVLSRREPAVVAPVVLEAPATPGKKGKRPRKAPRPGEAEPPGAEPEPVDDSIVLTAADLRTSSEGDALRAAATDLDLGAGAEGGPRDLTQEEIDGTFGRKGAAIVACITKARGAAPVSGRVTAGVVVGADGRVVKSRVEAPAYLLGHGLGACARRELESLRFPAVGKQTVVTVPFDVAD